MTTGIMKGLYLWCLKVTNGYHGVEIRNMTSSWKNGLALCAIINRFHPDLIDFYSLSPENIYYNNELAFGIAEKKFGIPRMLEAQDMVVTENPDRMSMATYLSAFYDYFKDSPMHDPPEKPEYEHLLNSSSASVSEILKVESEPKLELKDQNNVSLENHSIVHSVGDQENMENGVEYVFLETSMPMQTHCDLTNIKEVCLEEIKEVKPSETGAIINVVINMENKEVTGTRIGDAVEEIDGGVSVQNTVLSENSDENEKAITVNVSEDIHKMRKDYRNGDTTASKIHENIISGFVDEKLEKGVNCNGNEQDFVVVNEDKGQFLPVKLEHGLSNNGYGMLDTGSTVNFITGDIIQPNVECEQKSYFYCTTNTETNTKEVIPIDKNLSPESVDVLNVDLIQSEVKLIGIDINEGLSDGANTEMEIKKNESTSSSDSENRTYLSDDGAERIAAAVLANMFKNIGSLPELLEEINDINELQSEPESQLDQIICKTEEIQQQFQMPQKMKEAINTYYNNNLHCSNDSENKIPPRSTSSFVEVKYETCLDEFQDELKADGCVKEQNKRLEQYNDIGRTILQEDDNYSLSIPCKIPHEMSADESTDSSTSDSSSELEHEPPPLPTVGPPNLLKVAKTSSSSSDNDSNKIEMSYHPEYSPHDDIFRSMDEKSQEQSPREVKLENGISNTNDNVTVHCTSTPIQIQSKVGIHFEADKYLSELYIIDAEEIVPEPQNLQDFVGTGNVDAYNTTPMSPHIEMIVLQLQNEGSQNQVSEENSYTLLDETKCVSIQVYEDVSTSLENSDYQVDNMEIKQMHGGEVKLEYVAEAENLAKQPVVKNVTNCKEPADIDSSLLKKAALMSKKMAESLKAKVDEENNEKVDHIADANNTPVATCIQTEVNTLSPVLDEKEKKARIMNKQFQSATRPSKKIIDFEETDLSNFGSEVLVDFKNNMRNWERMSFVNAVPSAAQLGTDKHECLPKKRASLSSSFMLDGTSPNDDQKHLKNLYENLPETPMSGSVSDHVRKLSQQVLTQQSPTGVESLRVNNIWRDIPDHPTTQQSKLETNSIFSNILPSNKQLEECIKPESLNNVECSSSLNTQMLQRDTKKSHVIQAKDHENVSLKRSVSDVTPSLIFSGRPIHRHIEQRHVVRPVTLNVNVGDYEEKKELENTDKTPIPPVRYLRKKEQQGVDVTSLNKMSNLSLGNSEPGNQESDDKNSEKRHLNRQDSLQSKVPVEIKALEKRPSVSDEETPVEEKKTEVRRNESFKQAQLPKRSLSVTSPIRPSVVVKDDERIRNIWQESAMMNTFPKANRQDSLEVKVRPVSWQMKKDENEIETEHARSFGESSSKNFTPIKDYQKITVQVKPLTEKEPNTWDNVVRTKPSSGTKRLSLLSVVGKVNSSVETSKTKLPTSTNLDSALRPVDPSSNISIIVVKKADVTDVVMNHELVSSSVEKDVQFSAAANQSLSNLQKPKYEKYIDNIDSETNAFVSVESLDNKQDIESKNEESLEAKNDSISEYQKEKEETIKKCNSIFVLAKSNRKQKNEDKTKISEEGNREMSPLRNHEERAESENADKPPITPLRHFKKKGRLSVDCKESVASGKRSQEEISLTYDALSSSSVFCHHSSTSPPRQNRNVDCENKAENDKDANLSFNDKNIDTTYHTYNTVDISEISHQQIESSPFSDEHVLQIIPSSENDNKYASSFERDGCEATGDCNAVMQETIEVSKQELKEDNNMLESCVQSKMQLNNKEVVVDCVHNSSKVDEQKKFTTSEIHIEDGVSLIEQNNNENGNLNVFCTGKSGEFSQPLSNVENSQAKYKMYHHQSECENECDCQVSEQEQSTHKKGNKKKKKQHSTDTSSSSESRHHSDNDDDHDDNYSKNSTSSAAYNSHQILTFTTDSGTNIGSQDKNNQIKSDKSSKPNDASNNILMWKDWQTADNQPDTQVMNCVVQGRIVALETDDKADKEYQADCESSDSENDINYGMQQDSGAVLHAVMKENEGFGSIPLEKEAFFQESVKDDQTDTDVKTDNICKLYYASDCMQGDCYFDQTITEEFTNQAIGEGKFENFSEDSPCSKSEIRTQPDSWESPALENEIYQVSTTVDLKPDHVVDDDEEDMFLKSVIEDSEPFQAPILEDMILNSSLKGVLQIQNDLVQEQYKENDNSNNIKEKDNEENLTSSHFQENFLESINRKYSNEILPVHETENKYASSSSMDSSDDLYSDVRLEMNVKYVLLEHNVIATDLEDVEIQKTNFIDTLSDAENNHSPVDVQLFMIPDMKLTQPFYPTLKDDSIFAPSNDISVTELNKDIIISMEPSLGLELKAEDMKDEIKKLECNLYKPYYESVFVENEISVCVPMLEKLPYVNDEKLPYVNDEKLLYVNDEKLPYVIDEVMQNLIVESNRQQKKSNYGSDETSNHGSSTSDITGKGHAKVIAIENLEKDESEKCKFSSGSMCNSSRSSTNSTDEMQQRTNCKAESHQFLIGREKDPSKSDVARLVQQSLELDRRREELRQSEHERLKNLHDQFKPRDEVLEREHHRLSSESSKQDENETLDESSVEDDVEDQELLEDVQGGEVTPMSLPAGVDSDDSASSPEDSETKRVLEVLDLLDSSPDDVSPDMESQALFIKLKEAQCKNSLIEAKLTKLKGKLIVHENNEGQKKMLEKKTEEMASRLREMEKSLLNARKEINHYQDMMEGSQGDFIALEKKLKGEYTGLEKKYHKAKKLIKEYQQSVMDLKCMYVTDQKDNTHLHKDSTYQQKPHVNNVCVALTPGEKDFIAERESLLQQQSEKDQQYDALVKSLKDRIFQLEGELREAQKAAGLPVILPVQVETQKLEVPIVLVAKAFHSPHDSDSQISPSENKDSISSESDISGIEVDNRVVTDVITAESTMTFESLPKGQLLDISAQKAKAQLAANSPRRPPTKLQKLKSQESEENVETGSENTIENSLVSWMKHDSENTVKKSEHKKYKAHATDFQTPSSDLPTMHSEYKAHTTDFQTPSSDLPTMHSDNIAQPLDMQISQSTLPVDSFPVPPPAPIGGQQYVTEAEAMDLPRERLNGESKGSSSKVSQTSYNPSQPNFVNKNSEIAGLDSVSIDTAGTSSSGTGESESSSVGAGKKSKGLLPKLPFKFGGNSDRDKGGVTLVSSRNIDEADPHRNNDGGIILISKKKIDTGIDFDGASTISDTSSSYMVGDVESTTYSFSGTPGSEDHPSLPGYHTQNQFQSSQITDWNIDNVQHWLIGIEMEKYAALFTEKAINGPQLITLDSAKLKAMGISNAKDRDYMKKKLKELRFVLDKEKKQLEKERKQLEKDQKAKEKEQKKISKKK